MEAYGNASYVRLENSNGEVHCVLLFGKTRLCPVKRLTVPRLELTAATISLDIDKKVRTTFNNPTAQSFFWTDSTTVLRYILNKDKSFKTFVANRILKITENTNENQWFYVPVPTKQNPADIASRGMTITEFCKCNMWKHGPKFLWLAQDQWPTQPSFKNAATDDLEIKENKVSCFTTNTSIDNSNGIYKIPTDMTWNKLKNCVAWMTRYIKVLYNKTKGVSSDNLKSNVSLKLDELIAAEDKIIQSIQHQYFAKEIDALKSKRAINKSSSIIKLDPIIKNGIVRIGGRLKHSNLPEDSKYPILVPKQSEVAKLLIKHFHIECGHSGREFTLALLRERFWIPTSNQLARQIISRCFSCRKRQGSLGQQKMANLPESRVIANKPPFTCIGTDYFGPFTIKQGRSKIKRYGVLFTCFTTRAIHLELANKLDTDSFILALRRFIARRGMVEEIHSDNGTNYVGSQRELQNEIKKWNTHQINGMLLQKGIKWTFNTPAASHHGGVWERCIRTIRKLLSALCVEQHLEEECVHTLFCEVESVINGRPLTTVSEDPSDLNAITPNHLLLMKNTVNLPPGIFQSTDLYARKRWKQIQYLADVFWSRWTREYLPLLQQREKWNSSKRNFKINDIVLVMDHNLPRNSWMLGRVISTFNDQQGFVRSVRVKTKTSTIDRPISKICLLSAVEEANHTPQS